MASFAYRYKLDGNGPYESEKFESEADLEAAASERRHSVEEVLSFDEKGVAQSNVRESITVSDVAPADQPHTDGSQPA